jgi:hypothetical protein
VAGDHSFDERPPGAQSSIVYFPTGNILREIVQPPRKNLGHPPAHAKNKKPQPEFEASDWGEGAFAVEAAG